jgi:hypothetical protein
LEKQAAQNPAHFQALTWVENESDCRPTSKAIGLQLISGEGTHADCAGSLRTPYRIRLIMTHRQLALRTFVLALFLCALCAHVSAQKFPPTIFGSQAKTPQIATDKILKLTPKAEVDEQLFLIRKLEFLYLQWPTDLKDQKTVAKRLAALRYELVGVEAFATTKNYDKKVIALYSDTIELVDLYSDLLIKMGAIDENFYRELNKKALEGGIDNFREGFLGGGAAALLGIEPITASVILGGHFIKKAFEAHQEQQQLEEQRENEIENLQNDYLNKRSRRLGKFEAQLDFLLQENSTWDKNEVGFDQDEEESQRILKATQTNDRQFLMERLITLSKVRPRDPFVFGDIGNFCADMAWSAGFEFDNDETAEGWRKHAVDNYLQAVRLIPSGRFHDGLRTEYLLKAAQNASASLYHSGNKSALPITIANTALKVSPRDADGRIRKVKAWALARNGVFDEAINLYQQVGTIRGRDDRFHYGLACLLSMAGKVEDSMRHLKVAWEMGYRQVRHIRKDKDLVGLRREKREDYLELWRPKWSWGMVHGTFFWNDLKVQNKSGYPWTKVVVKATWKGTDGTEYSEVYWAPSIRVNETYTFEGVFDNASESEYDKAGSRFEFKSEETRIAIRTQIKDVVGNYSGVATVMEIDGSSIKTTSQAILYVRDAQDGKLRLKFSGEDVEIEVGAKTLKDGSTGFGSQIRAGKALHVYFHGKTAYGWCQNATDAENDEIRVFWLERR